MNSHGHCENTSACEAAIHESRSERFNLPIRHQAIWRILLDQILASPMRLHRYRDLNRRIVEDALYKKDCGGRK